MKKLFRVIDEHKTQKAAAAHLGIDLAHLRAILYGDRQLGPMMLAALRLRKAPDRYIDLEVEDVT